MEKLIHALEILHHYKMFCLLWSPCLQNSEEKFIIHQKCTNYEALNRINDIIQKLNYSVLPSSLIIFIDSIKKLWLLSFSLLQRALNLCIWKCHGVTQKSDIFNVMRKMEFRMKLFLYCKSPFHRPMLCRHPIINTCHGSITITLQSSSQRYFLRLKHKPP